MRPGRTGARMKNRLLERQRWLDVTDRLVFEPGAIGDPESEVHRILAAAANEHRGTTDTPFDQSGVTLAGKLGQLSGPCLLRHVVRQLENAERKVHDIRRLGSAVVASEALCIENGK